LAAGYRTGENLSILLSSRAGLTGSHLPESRRGGLRCDHHPGKFDQARDKACYRFAIDRPSLHVRGVSEDEGVGTEMEDLRADRVEESADRLPRTTGPIGDPPLCGQGTRKIAIADHQAGLATVGVSEPAQPALGARMAEGDATAVFRPIGVVVLDGARAADAVIEGDTHSIRKCVECDQELPDPTAVAGPEIPSRIAEIQDDRDHAAIHDAGVAEQGREMDGGALGQDRPLLRCDLNYQRRMRGIVTRTWPG
jgi:hypothetical protein